MKLGLRRIKGPTLSLVLEISKKISYDYEQIMCYKTMVKGQYVVRSDGNAGSIIGHRYTKNITFIYTRFRNR